MKTTLSYPSRMSEGKNKGGRPKGKRYPARLMIYTTERSMELLQAIADRRETSLAEVVRQMILAEAKREGLE